MQTTKMMERKWTSWSEERALRFIFRVLVRYSYLGVQAYDGIRRDCMVYAQAYIGYPKENSNMVMLAT